MNYYPRYPGDYVIKTLGLTMVEDGAYTRLLDWYFSNEEPIEHERRHIVSRATTAAEKAAVDLVLKRYFFRDGEVYKHERASEEITKASPRIMAAKANGAKGGRRPKSEAKKNPDGNPLGFGNKNPSDNPEDNPPGYPSLNPEGTQRASSPTPYPEPEEIPGDGLTLLQGQQAQPPTDYGRIAGALRRAGISNASPAPLRFRNLVDAGVGIDEFLALAPKAVEVGDKPFEYLLGAVEGERKRAAKTAGQLHRGELPATETPYARQMREKYEQATPQIAAKRPGTERTPNPMEVLDGLTRIAR